MAKRASSKREPITGRNRMYSKRDVQGRSREMDDVSRSLGRSSQTAVKSGPGAPGNRKRRS